MMAPGVSLRAPIDARHVSISFFLYSLFIIKYTKKGSLCVETGALTLRSPYKRKYATLKSNLAEL